MDYRTVRTIADGFRDLVLEIERFNHMLKNCPQLKNYLINESQFIHNLDNVEDEINSIIENDIDKSLYDNVLDFLKWEVGIE